MNSFETLRSAFSQDISVRTASLQEFAGDELGATSIEYGLIAVVVSVAIIASLSYFTDSLNALWNHTSSTVVRNL